MLDRSKIRLQRTVRLQAAQADSVPGGLQSARQLDKLPQARMRRAAGHLEACAPCRDRLGRIEAAVVRVNAWLDALAPAGLPALDDAVPRIAAKTSGLRWRWAAVALAGALAASVALFFANSRPHPEPARAAKREAGMH